MKTFVIDTNVIFSALYDLQSGAGKLLFSAIDGQIDLIASEYIKGELERNLKEKLGYTDEEFEETIKALPVKWVDDELYSRKMDEASKLIAHERDVPILALALHMGCGVVSGDGHLLGAKGIRVWKITEVLSSLEGP